MSRSGASERRKRAGGASDSAPASAASGAGGRTPAHPAAGGPPLRSAAFASSGGAAAAVATVAVVIAAAYLVLVRLDNTLFWDDEAQVAIPARNLLTHGRSTGWDGRNLMAYRNGGLLDDHLDVINPPLQNWLCAASFRVLGATTFAGRLPFALCGVASIGLLAWLTRREFPHHPWMAFFTTAAFALSPTTLLHARQCRYYAACFLLGLLTYAAYRRFMRTARLIDAALLSAAGVLLFLPHYLVGAAFVLSLALLHLATGWRESTRRHWIGLLAAAGLYAALVTPYAMYYRIWFRPDMPDMQPLMERWPVLLWRTLRDLNTVLVLPWSVVVAFAGLAALTLFRRGDRELMRPALRWALFGMLNIVIIAAVAPQSIKLTRTADLRYCVAVYPFLAGLTGVVLAALWGAGGFTRWPPRAQRTGADVAHANGLGHQWIVRRVAAMVVLAAALLCNVHTLWWQHRTFWWTLPAYLREVHHDYPTSYVAVVDYLREHARQDDAVYCHSEYTNYPVMFYLGDKLRIGCLLNRDTHLPLDKVRALDAPLLREDHAPDWFIAFGMRSSTQAMLNYLSQPRVVNGRAVAARYRQVQTLDAYYEDLSRPDLLLHHFGPKTQFDRKRQAVYVYRRE